MGGEAHALTDPSEMEKSKGIGSKEEGGGQTKDRSRTGEQEGKQATIFSKANARPFLEVKKENRYIEHK